MGPLFVAQVEFFCRSILDHLSGAASSNGTRGLKVVLTEQGSGWVPSKLAGMDYSYDGSYLRRDIREVIRLRPSEYFARQVYLGSSLLDPGRGRTARPDRRRQDDDRRRLPAPRGHVERRHAELPAGHLRRERGTAGRGPPDARRERRSTCSASTPRALRPIAERIGPDSEFVLAPPAEDLFPRGDVHKPLGGANIG